MIVKIIEVPLDFGASRHGADMGPSAIRLAGIRTRLESLEHKIEHCIIPIEIPPQEYEDVGNAKAKYLKPIVSVCENLAATVEKSFKEKLDSKTEKIFPLILGGDHSILLGSLAGVSAIAKNQNKRLGVLYVDAHGDFNTTETTPSGNIHGQCLAASCGYGIPELTNLYFNDVKVNPKNICYVGVRDIDKGERELMKNAGVTVFSISDIDRLGFPEVLKRVTNFFNKNCDMVHVSFDMDSLDPMYAPGTGIRLSAGLTNREALLLMEEMNNTNVVCSADIVEVNPVCDEHNRTSELAVDLAARLLGEKLY